MASNEPLPASVKVGAVELHSQANGRWYADADCRLCVCFAEIAAHPDESYWYGYMPLSYGEDDQVSTDVGDEGQSSPQLAADALAAKLRALKVKLERMGL